MLMLNKTRPHNLLLIIAVTLIPIIVFIQTTTEKFHNTMFLTPTALLVWMIPTWLILFWLVYVCSNKFLYSVTITRIHIAITICTAILILTALYFEINPFESTSSRYYTSAVIERKNDLIGQAMRAALTVLIFGQSTYFINVFYGLFGNRKN
jgi:hypothetical protein